MISSANDSSLLADPRPAARDATGRVEVPFSDDFQIVVSRRPQSNADTSFLDHPSVAPRLDVPIARESGRIAEQDVGGRGDPALEDEPTEKSLDPEIGRNDGCVICTQLPVVSGATLVQKPSPTSETCDGKTREFVDASISWNNAPNRDFNNKYMKSANEASVYSTIQTFDAAIAAVGVLSETIKGLPETFVSNGLSTVDDKVRAVRDALADLAYGKLDDDALEPYVDWDFDLAEAAEVTIKHVHQWLAFTEDSGIYDFQVDGFIDRLPVKELSALSAADRTALKPAPAAAAPAVPTSGGGGAEPKPAPIITPPAVFADRLSIPQEFTGSPGSTTMSLRAGRHHLQLVYRLKAGFGGLFDEDGIDTANRLLNDVLAAVQSLGKLLGIAVRRLFGAAVQPGEPTTAQALAEFTANATKAALSAADLLIALLKKLFQKSLAYVRMFSTDIEISCDMAAKP